MQYYAFIVVISGNAIHLYQSPVDILDKSQRQISRNIKELKNKGIIKRVGRKLYCVSYYYANNLAVKPEKAGKM